MAERTSQEMMDVFLKEVQEGEDATTTGERMRHFHIAEEQYNFIAGNDDGFFSAAEVSRATRAMEHLRSLVESEDEEI